MWAFSDESERAGVMLFALVLIHPGDAAPARTRLRGLLLPGQRRIHTTDESARRRRLLVDAVADTHGLSATLFRYQRPAGTDRLRGRHLIVQAATGRVIGSGVRAWWLDDQDPAQKLRDRASIAHALSGVDQGLHPVYDHVPARSEPLLWAADAICWAAGAGSEWRRQLDRVLTVQDIKP